MGKRRSLSDGDLPNTSSFDDDSEDNVSYTSYDETEDSNVIIEALLLKAKQRKKQREIVEKVMDTIIPKKKEKR